MDTASQAAVEVLRACVSPDGLLASAGPGGHREVWARDSMISLLGASLVEDARIRAALGASLATLRRHRTPLGLIPNQVEPAAGRANFRAYADGGLWYVIGCSLLDPDPGSIRETLAWYDYQDVDASGVLSMQEASGWMDLFAARGKTLYLNCLWAAALRLAGHAERAGRLARRVNELFWYAGDGETLRHLTHSFTTPNHTTDSLGRKRALPGKRILAGERYYLSYLSLRDLGEWFDTFGHLLAILAGVAGPEQTALILDFIDRHGIAEAPAMALYPVVEPGDPDWRDYYGTVNEPWLHHNAGVWPFLGGFYVAALVHAGRLPQAAAALERLARLNLEGNFNEWHHGRTHRPMGVERQAWSAAMLLYAAACVRRCRPCYPFDGSLR